jgi:hypothetical protein
MGARGPNARALREHCRPGTPEFQSLVLGPVPETKNTVDVARRRWKDGGREAVLAHYREPGRRAWAWWCFDEPELRKISLGYPTEAQSIIGLGLADAAELAEIEALGIIADQLANDPAPTPAEVATSKRLERKRRERK